MTSSYTSLFRINAVSKHQSTLEVRDILQENKDLALLDISFSRTSQAGL